MSAVRNDVGPFSVPTAKPLWARLPTAHEGSTCWSRIAWSVDHQAPVMWLRSPYWFTIARVSTSCCAGVRRAGILDRLVDLDAQLVGSPEA